MENNVKINLFNLIDEDERRPGSWIMAKGENLNEVLKPLISKVTIKFGSKKKLSEHLQHKFNLSQSVAERFVFLMKEWQPLFLIKEIADLVNLSPFELQENIDLLKINKPPVKIYNAVKELNEDLCKIIGAHAADGTLNGNYFRINDGYKSNILAFRKWIVNVFGVEYPIKKISENEYFLTFHSGFISSYLRKIFDFPSGMKVYIVSEPEIIKKSNLNFRKSFAIGALTFEAGVGMRHQIELCVSSKDFRDSIAEILGLLNIKFTKMKNSSNTYWRLWSNKLSEDDVLKWIELFEPETEKWFKMHDLIYGYNGQVNSLEEAIEKLNKVYPFNSANKICLKDILLAISSLKTACRYELISYLCKNNNLSSFGGKWGHSLAPYLDILKKANIIRVQKNKYGMKKSFGSVVRKVYIYNPTVSQWRIPIRE